MATIFQVYTANPLSALNDSDLIPIGEDPGGTPADGAINFGDFMDSVGADLISTLSGTSWPTSPSSGDFFFRTDLAMWFYWDGTSRWKSVQQFSASVVTALTADTNLYFKRVDDRYDYSVDRIAMVTYVDTTNNGSNYWNILPRSYNSDLSNSTTIRTMDTSADSPDTYTDNDQDPTGANMAYKGVFGAWIYKTSSPGTLTIMLTLYYRRAYLIT